MPEIPPTKKYSLAVNEDVKIDGTMFLMNVVTRCSPASLYSGTVRIIFKHRK